jgi:soluble cytochrome b562
MNLRFSLLLTALLATSGLLHAQQNPAQPDSPLEKQMQILARGKRQLTTQVADPAKQQQTITLIESLKKASVNSKSLDPRKTASVPAADREKFLASYRAQMDKLTDALNQMEEAVKAGQYDKAKSLLGSLQSIMKEGHREFKQD